MNGSRDLVIVYTHAVLVQLATLFTPEGSHIESPSVYRAGYYYFSSIEGFFQRQSCHSHIHG